jgi:hypothetical protein
MNKYERLSAYLRSLTGKARIPLKAEEAPLERAASEHIGAMDVLWLEVEDPEHGAQLRGYIERNAIALLSNHDKDMLDAASPDWLGHHSDRERVRSSHLWNNNHVNEGYDPAFLDELAWLIAGAGTPNCARSLKLALAPRYHS